MPTHGNYFTSSTVADLGGRGGDGGMHPPHQPKPNDFARKISLNFGEDLFNLTHLCKLFNKFNETDCGDVECLG